MSFGEVYGFDSSGNPITITVQVDDAGGGAGDATFTVSGRVMTHLGVGLENYRVTMRHFVAGGSHLNLGSQVKTNSNGEYSIIFLRSDLPEGVNFPTYYALVEKEQTLGAEDWEQQAIFGHEPKSTTSLLYTLNFVIGNEPFVGPPEFEGLYDLFSIPYQNQDPALTEQEILDAVIAATKELTDTDINILATSPGYNVFDKTALTSFRNATRLYFGEATNTVTLEAFHAFMRYDLPTNFSMLRDLPDARLTEALQTAKRIANNIIDPEFDSSATVTAIGNLRNSGLLADPISLTGNSYMSQILEIAGIPVPIEGQNEDGGADSVDPPGDVPWQQENFAEVYAQYGHEQDFWDRNEVRDAFDGDEATRTLKRDNVKLAFQLGVICQEHIPLINQVYTSVTAIEDIAVYDKTEWLSLIETDLGGGEIVGVPGISPDIENYGLRKSEYAIALLNAAEEAFPTEVLLARMNAEAPLVNFENVRLFLVNNLTYDIKENSPRQFFADNGDPGDPTKSEIYELKRLWHLSRGYNKWDDIKALKGAALTSASQIAAYGERSFIKNFASIFDGLVDDEFTGTTSEEKAKTVFKKAVKRVAAASELQVTYSSAVNNVSTQTYRDTSVGDVSKGSEPRLDVLFGSQDYCACRHCRSSFSPAAYLADLLGFLKLIPKTAGGGNAWEELKTRRTEFAQIKLTCDNTNIVLPYIDIVNEVLETAIDGSGGSHDRQTTLDKESLRIYPEHIQSSVYDTLSTDDYTWELPFHLWNSEANAYLEMINLSRFDIARSLLNLTYFTNESALVYLGISSGLKSILDSNTFSSSFGNKTSDYLSHVDQLLEQSDISYEHLLNLLGSSFINPDSTEIQFTPADSCSLENARLQFPSGNYNQELKNLHRFERLRRVLGWEVSDLDMALIHFGADDSDFKINELAGLKWLAEKYRLSIAETLSWFAPLSQISYDGKASQYDEVFLNPFYNRDDTIRTDFTEAKTTGDINLLDAQGQLNDTHAPVILAATGLKADELLQLVTKDITDGTVVAADELSYFYRVASFTKALRISVKDFLDVRDLFRGNRAPVDLKGTVYAADPHVKLLPNETIQFLKDFELLMSSSLNMEDIRFIFLQQQLESYQADTATLTESLENLRTKYVTRLGEVGISINRTREDLANLFALFFDENIVSQSLEIVDGVISDEEVAANAFIDTYWDSLVTSVGDVKSGLVTSGSVSFVTAAEDRIDFVFAQFHNALIGKLRLKEEWLQAISEFFDIGYETVSGVLEEKLGSASNYLSLELIYDSTVLSDTTFDVHRMDLIKLIKTGLVFEKLGVAPRHISFLLDGDNGTNWYIMTDAPTSVPDLPLTNFDGFISLLEAYQLNGKYQNSSQSIIDIIQQNITHASQVAITTGWSIADISYATTSNPPNPALVPVGMNQDWLIHLDRINDALNKMKLPLEKARKLLLEVNGSSEYVPLVDLTQQQSLDIQSVVRSLHSENAWKKSAVEVRDKLRALQRDALTAYLIGNSGFADKTSLYEHYLLDVEMEPCMLTSRIKLAISSVQLWIQRIQMGLESEFTIDDEALDEWKWRKNYRVWEAARKVFVYPENWIEPELRDDKSPFFEELEDELLQGEVTDESAEIAYLNYLNKLDDVALLEISGIYNEEDRGILHVYARTKNEPHRYYYRTQEDGFRWTPWQGMDLDIEGDHLVPVVFNRRPMIFWPVFSELPLQPDEEQLKIQQYNQSVINDEPSKIPLKEIQIKLAFSEWKNNKWQPKKISKQSLSSLRGLYPENYFFKLVIENGELGIDTFYNDESIFNHLGSFSLDNCTSDLVANDVQYTAKPSPFSVNNSDREFMKIKGKADIENFAITEKMAYTISEETIVDGNTLNDLPEAVVDEKVILQQISGNFRITYPVTGVDLLSKVPFFFEDQGRVFFVEPSEEQFTRKVINQLPVRIVKIKRYTKYPIPTSIKNLLLNGSQV
ncbi:MAG: hypothetical protein JXR03_01540 [Cyclobacteriaceae bacterium]